jgi:hypothetical protein
MLACYLIHQTRRLPAIFRKSSQERIPMLTPYRVDRTARRPLRVAVFCLLVFIAGIAPSGCEEGTEPEPVQRGDITRSFSAEVFTTTTGGATVDQKAAGATVMLSLNPDGTTSGRLFVPGGGEAGIDANLAGSFEFNEERSEVTLQHSADTFLRDMVFDASQADGVVRLESSKAFGNTTIRITLRAT